ncbi:hypothetical protein [Acetoanaerobium noterae]|uniref:hypothetical protein n=1 Tax=Acetoanaerobium noterae TaxID=745369 RepID=UPI0033211E17
MAVIKYCKNCNEKISLRQMPNGYWLPFEFQEDKLHECKIYKNEKNITDLESNIKAIGLTNREKIDMAIASNKDLYFEYTSFMTGEKLKRKITPVSIYEEYVNGYCYLSNSRKSFIIDNMRYLKIIEKSENINLLEKQNQNITTNNDKLENKKQKIATTTANSENIKQKTTPNIDNNKDKEEKTYKWIYFIIIFIIVCLLYIYK